MECLTTFRTHTIAGLSQSIFEFLRSQTGVVFDNGRWGCHQTRSGDRHIATERTLTGTTGVNKTWFLIAASLGVFATQGMIQVVPPLLAEIASDIQISVAVAGQLVTVTFAAWAVSVVLVGPLSDTFGRRPVAIFGLLSLSISVLASAFAPNLEVLMALRVLTGLGGGTIPPNTVGAIADVISPERRAQAVSAMLAIGMFS